MKRIFAGVLSTVCLCGSLVLAADEATPPPHGGGMGEGRRQGGGRGGRGRVRMDPSRNPIIRRLAAEAALKAQAPEEYAAAVKAQAAAAAAWKAAAAKAKVTLPEDTADYLQTIREKAPEEYDELLKLAVSDPQAALQKWREAAEKAGIKFPMFRGGPGRGGPGERGGDREAPAPGSRQTTHVPIAKLRQQFPEEMARYDELKKSDPAKARELLRDLMRRMNGPGGPKAQK